MASIHLRVGGSIVPGASGSLSVGVHMVSATRAALRPVIETMSPAAATSKSMRPVPALFQIFVSLFSSIEPPADQSHHCKCFSSLHVLAIWQRRDFLAKVQLYSARFLISGQ